MKRLLNVEVRLLQRHDKLVHDLAWTLRIVTDQRPMHDRFRILCRRRPCAVTLTFASIFSLQPLVDVIELVLYCLDALQSGHFRHVDVHNYQSYRVVLLTFSMCANNGAQGVLNEIYQRVAVTQGNELVLLPHLLYSSFHLSPFGDLVVGKYDLPLVVSIVMDRSNFPHL